MTKTKVNILQTADGLDTLYSEKYQQTYHSLHGVLQEARHVFLQGAGVDQKLEKHKNCSVLEIGFGTGFNFFLTAGFAQKQNAELEFVSLEKDLLPSVIFSRLNHDLIENAIFVRQYFQEWRQNLPEKPDPGDYLFEAGKTKLLLKIGNAINAELPESAFDAVYLDAFSPEQNPELWTTNFFKKIIKSMRPNSLLSTYSAKGSVRRALMDAGFEVVKKQGPKGKREMLAGKKAF